MKPIAILVLGMGIMGSAVVQAQQTGQGSAVPRPNIVVAEAPGTLPVPPVVTVETTAAAELLPALVVVSVAIAGVVAAGKDSATVTHH